MPVLPNTVPEMMPMQAGGTPAASPITATVEAAKRVPGALLNGAFIGGAVGLGLGACLMALESFTSVPFASTFGIHSLLSPDFALHFGGAHAIGHALYDGVVESKAKYDEVMHKTGTLAEREAQAENAMAKAVEHGLESPVMAVEREVGMLADRKPPSRAVQDILARGAQTQDTASWRDRMAVQDAQRARHTTDIPL